MTRQQHKHHRAAYTLLFSFALAMASFTLAAHAAAPATPTLTVTPSTLTALTSGGCWWVGPCYAATGRTDGGVKVTVVAMDANGKTASATTYSAERDDPGNGTLTGDFSAAPGVTDLGLHDTTSSILTFTAYAEDSAGNKSPVSAPVLVTKLAATAGDTVAPTFTRLGGVPGGMMCGTGWCNIAFPPCVVYSLLGNLPGGDPRHACTGRYRFTGLAEDKDDTGNSIVSEINAVWMTVTDASGNVVTHVNGIGARRGYQAPYIIDLLATDYTEGQTYTYSVVAIDAAGNESAPWTGTFTRYPL